MPADLSPYLSGEKLYGDDFGPAEIAAWFQDEAEGYAELGAGDRARYRYGYHALNRRHGFRRLGDRRFRHVLGLGSAYGDEFQPVLRQLDRITVLDPSEAFAGARDIGGVPCEYHKPQVDGSLPFATGSFDLITCLGVLHHIPNVSRVMGECGRVLEPGGLMVIREPIFSMGDWTRPRPGLTRRERGISLRVFREIIGGAGFAVRHEALCNFPALPRLAGKFGLEVYNSPAATALDALLSRAFAWNARYHRPGLLAKLAPAAVYFVLAKD